MANFPSVYPKSNSYHADPAYLKMLITGNGSLKDIISGGRIITPTGTAGYSTGAQKFYVGSMHIPAHSGGGNYITVPKSADFAFGTGLFGVSFWLNYEANANNTYQLIYCDSGYKWGNPTGFSIFYSYQAGEGKSYWVIYSMGAGNLSYGFSVTESKPATGVWQHIEIDRVDSLTLRCFRDGVQFGSDIAIPSGAVFGDANYDMIFSRGAANGSSNFEGYLDEITFQKGAPLHTATFAPTTRLYLSPYFALINGVETNLTTVPNP